MKAAELHEPIRFALGCFEALRRCDVPAERIFFGLSNGTIYVAIDDHTGFPVGGRATCPALAGVDDEGLRRLLYEAQVWWNDPGTPDAELRACFDDFVGRLPDRVAFVAFVQRRAARAS